MCVGDKGLEFRVQGSGFRGWGFRLLQAENLDRLVPVCVLGFRIFFLCLGFRADTRTWSCVCACV